MTSIDTSTTSISASTSLPLPPRIDDTRPVLSVFQADPLAYDNISGGATALLPRLDIESERHEFRERLLGNNNNNNVRIEFRIATVDNLCDYLRRQSRRHRQKNHNNHRYLHLSCHGNPRMLCIENHYGGAQPLNVMDDYFEKWIQGANNNNHNHNNNHHTTLQCVFVAACQSRSAGEAFLKAGVTEYVVCCADDSLHLSDAAAKIFAAHFYTSLLSSADDDSSTVQEAFDFAQPNLFLSSELRETAGVDPEQEAKKLVLLRRNYNNSTTTNTRNMDDATTTTPTTTSNIILPSSPARYSSHHHHPKDDETQKDDIDTIAERRLMTQLPRPPDNFVGREVVMYQVLKAMMVQKVRLVTISGPKEIGKGSFAQALAQYMQRRTMLWGNVIWAAPGWRSSTRGVSTSSLGSDGSIAEGDNNNDNKDPIDILDDMLNEMITLLENDALMQQTDDYVRLRERICTTILQKGINNNKNNINNRNQKAVFIIDARRLEKRVIQKGLSKFLYEFFRGTTEQIKVIVVLREGSSLSEQASQRVSMANFPLEPLDYNTAMALFTKNCPFANSSLSSSSSNNKNYTAFEVDINNMYRKEYNFVLTKLGGGIPGQTVRQAHGIVDAAAYTQFLRPAGFIYILSNPSKLGIVQPLPVPASQSSTLAPIRGQAEVRARFLHQMKEEGSNNKVYRKVVPSHIRKAKRGETVTTTIDSLQESHQTVVDDTSYVVRGPTAGEFYVVTAAQLEENYDVSSKRPIKNKRRGGGERVDNNNSRRWREKGFWEYSPVGQAWAHVVNDDDMRFFHFGGSGSSGTTIGGSGGSGATNNNNSNNNSTAEDACFMAPWGETTLVQKGDYLVCKCGSGSDDNDDDITKGSSSNNEIYRVDKEIFEKTYSSCFRTQKEVQEEFMERLLNKDNNNNHNKDTKSGKIYCNITPGYIRRAWRGEAVVTSVAGQHSNQQIVNDDKSWVLWGGSDDDDDDQTTPTPGVVDGEFTVLTNQEFVRNYDPKSRRPIKNISIEGEKSKRNKNAKTISNKNAVLVESLQKKYFFEYTSIGKVRAYELEKEDMQFFLRGAEDTETAYLVAPWGETMIVRLGDYLVTECSDDVDSSSSRRKNGIYRIERDEFEKSYRVHGGQNRWKWMISATIGIVASVTVVVAATKGRSKPRS